MGMGLARCPLPRSGWAAGIAWGPGKARAGPSPTRRRAGGGRPRGWARRRGCRECRGLGAGRGVCRWRSREVRGGGGPVPVPRSLTAGAMAAPREAERERAPCACAKPRSGRASRAPTASIASGPTRAGLLRADSDAWWGGGSAGAGLWAGLWAGLCGAEPPERGERHVGRACSAPRTARGGTPAPGDSPGTE